MSPPPGARAKVVGVGNELRGDDAAGLLVARRLRDLAGPGVEVLEVEGEPTRLIEMWQDADAVVVVDAVRSGAPAGTVSRFDAAAAPLPVSAGAGSTHALGLGEAIELARTLDRLPARLVVYAIEGGRFEAGAGVSAPVAAAVDRVAGAVLAEVDPST